MFRKNKEKKEIKNKQLRAFIESKRHIDYSIIVILSIILCIFTIFTFTFNEGVLISSQITSMSDPGLFNYLGYMLSKGNIPYVDFWDHKGIVTMLVHAIPWVIPGDHSFNAWLMVCGFMIVNTILVYELIRKIKHERPNMISIILTMLCYASWTVGGSVEEQELIFIITSLMLTIDYMESLEKVRANNLRAFFIGLCYFMIFNIRVKEVIFALVPFAVLTYNEIIVNRRFKRYFGYLGYALCGLLLPFIPLLLWFYSKGALDAWIFGNITFSMEYTKVASDMLGISGFISQLLENGRIVILLPVITTAELLYKDIKRKGYLNDMTVFLTSFTVVIVLVNLIGLVAAHYMLVCIPLLPYFFDDAIDDLFKFVNHKFKGTDLLKAMSKIAIFIFVACMMVITYPKACYDAKAYLRGLADMTYMSDATPYPVENSVIGQIEHIEEITGEDIENIYLLDCSPNVYTFTNTDPKQIYLGYQSWWSYYSETMKNKMIDDFKNGNYEYILSNDNKQDLGKDFQDNLIEGYEVFEQTSYYTIYKKVN